MSSDREHFHSQWQIDGEPSEPWIEETGWKRVQQVGNTPQALTASDLDAGSLKETFAPLLRDPDTINSIEESKTVTVHADRLPWKATNIHLQAGKKTSAFAIGRVWRSRLMDLYLRPQATLCYKIGVNGKYFNASRDSITFEAETDGELFVASQFPGQFQEPCGRVLGNLDVYDKADGNFEVLFIVWKPGTDVENLLQEYCSHNNVTDLIHIESRRPAEERQSAIPPDWYYFWYIGSSTIYRSLPSSASTSPCIHCKPYQNVGILQKDLQPPLPFQPGSTISWAWKIDSLPSRLREDTTFTHDYLSVAVEFENGRDITYTWSWELPVEYGYWCPLPTWTDREYHVVVRSGEVGLGEWLREERDLYRDYGHYIGGQIPERIVRVWLIAGNRWQRYEGEMTVRDIALRQDDGKSVVQVL